MPLTRARKRRRVRSSSRPQSQPQSQPQEVVDDTRPIYQEVEDNEPDEKGEGDDEKYQYADSDDEGDEDDDDMNEESEETLLEKQLNFVFSHLPPVCHCLSCFEYMGEMNPRQYCCKSYCPFEHHEPIELALIRISNLKGSPYEKDSHYSYYIKRALRYGKFVFNNFRN